MTTQIAPEAIPALFAEARKQGFIAGLAYAKVAEADPVASFCWFNDRCTEASNIDRQCPGYYAEFVQGIDERRTQIKQEG